MPSPYSARASLPSFYWWTITTIEPFLALAGAIATSIAPANYLNAMSPSAVYDPTSKFLFTQLIGAWLVFAFNEAVVLRLFDEWRVWKVMIFGMLLSDIPYAYSTVQGIGGWDALVDVKAWRAEDYAVILGTVYPVGIRILALLGIGVTKRSARDKRD